MYSSEIFSLFMLVVIKNSCSTLPPQSSNKTDIKFKTLEACLAIAGVKEDNIIHRSNGSRYVELNKQWNTLNGYVKPMAYLIASNVLDIQSAVICCQLFKVHFVARSGGHSYIKSGFGDSKSLVIDLQRLNKIEADSAEMNCEIGPGAQVNAVSHTLLKKGNFVVPVGICPTVGVGGLTLGGGYGYFTRKYGISSDSLLELEMVNAKGQLLIINQHTDKDLFWALRGGGGGNFGIVTKFKFKMYEAPKSVVFGLYHYSFDHFSVFFKAWQSFITSNIPNNIGSQIEMKKHVINMEIFYFNFENIDNVTMSEMDINNLLSSFSFPKPTGGSIKLQSYYDFLITSTEYYSNPDDYTGWKKVKSLFVNKVLDEQDIAELQKLLKAYLEWSKLYFVHDGGAIDKFTRSETAFVHRNDLYNVQLQAFNAHSDKENLVANSGMNTFYEKSKLLFDHRESYQNFLDQDITDYLERYYGENLKRLIQIKMRIDPLNVFNHPQSIPTAFN